MVLVSTCRKTCKIQQAVRSCKDKLGKWRLALLKEYFSSDTELITLKLSQ